MHEYLCTEFIECRLHCTSKISLKTSNRMKIAAGHTELSFMCSVLCSFVPSVMRSVKCAHVYSAVFICIFSLVFICLYFSNRDLLLRITQHGPTPLAECQQSKQLVNDDKDNQQKQNADLLLAEKAALQLLALTMYLNHINYSYQTLPLTLLSF